MRLPVSWKRLAVRLKKGVRTYRNRFKDVEVQLYDVNLKLRPYFRMANIALFAGALTSLVLLAGFDLDGRALLWLDYLDLGIAAGFITVYVSRLLLTTKRLQLVKSRLLESLLFLLLLLIGMTSLVGGDSFIELLESLTGLNQAWPALVLSTKIYLVLFVSAKLIQSAPLLLSVRRNPAEVIVGGFTALILLGSLLLMLPNATLDGQGLPFIDALFTSTSAVCVTGLIVVDTATHFTLLGECIILALIQLGGIGIITFATLFALFLNNNLGTGQMNFLKDIVSEDRAQETLATIRRIVALTFIVEAIGVAGYYMSWTELLPDAGNRFYFAIFHAISAFCNAGFSLFTNSFADPANTLNTGVNITTMLLIILGGLGFTTIWELVRGNRSRKAGLRHYSVHTRLVIGMTVILIAGGTLVFITTEWNNTLGGMGWGQKLMVSAFQSITTRTAGFNTVAMDELALGTTVLFLGLMAVGASPASTGGGIKTTTVAVLLLKVWSTIRGKERVEFAKRTISRKTVSTAVTAFVLAALSLFVFTFMLTLTEDLPFTDLIFEEFSAFATVGLSRGITASLSNTGKIIVTLSMFIGRVGSVTLALAFARKVKTNKYRYPEESVIVA